jgi:CRP-like cAMP-binding protein
VQQALAEASISNIAEHPPANCILMDFDASFGRYAVRYWLNDLMADDATDSAVRDHIFAALQRHGIRLAFPEYNVHTIKEGEKHQQARHFHRVQERIGVLQKIELFNGFREDELLDIAQKLKYAPFATGDIITHQGEASHWLYILTEGEVEVFLETPQQQRRKLSTLQAGSYFGEMGMMTGSPRTASVIASRDCECYLLDKDAFEQVLHNRPELAEEISQTLVSRRFGLDSLRHEVDDGMRALEMARQHQDMTSRIRHFFGLRDNT